jgi:tRNA (guanine37-N1)-methyltransferase
MVFHLVTIFPESIKGYFNCSILKRGQKKKLIKIKYCDPRDFVKDKHKKTDDKPFGGGPGMVFKIEPIAKTIDSILKVKSQKSKVKIVLLSPAGRQFTQETARKWAKNYKNIVLISGHYEGIDERVAKIFRTEKISVGPYVLTGGELAAGVVVDAVSRHIPGVLGKKESLEEKRGLLGAPAYTRPEVFEWKGKKYRVPRVLLSGNHAKIEEWRRKMKRD